MKKPLTAPRKVYSRRGVKHVCFAGTLFGPEDNEKSAITNEDEVSCELINEEDPKSGCKVTLRRRGKKNVTETWHPVKLKIKKRAA